MTVKQRLGHLLLPHLPVNRRTFDILRFEFGLLFRRRLNTLSPLYTLRLWRLARCSELSLNLGSGGRGLPGWVNVDARRHGDGCLVIDIRRGLPFRSGSVRRVLAEHVLEHLDFRSDVPFLLTELHRVMAGSAVLRVIVPDAERYLEAYTAKDPTRWRALGWNLDALPDDIFTPMHIVNHVFHQSGEHLFAYDYETLWWVLVRAGFHCVVRQDFCISLDKELAIDQPNHAPYSLYVEAVR